MIKNSKKQTKVSIIIINYKTDKLILNLLNSLKSDQRIEIIIVDNSPKNTLEKKLPKRSDVHYVFSNSNLGFSGGNNLGISRANGEWLFLLNSDTIAKTKDILYLLKETIKHKYLVSCPKLIQPNGMVQNNIGVFSKLSQNPLNYLLARPRFLDCSNITSDTPVDLLTGAAMLINRLVFKKVGLLDDKNFFMYFEDIDFSYRLNKAMIKVLFCPNVVITHFGGASSDQDARQKNSNYQLGLKTYLTLHRGKLINAFNDVTHLFS